MYYEVYVIFELKIYSARVVTYFPFEIRVNVRMQHQVCDKSWEKKFNVSYFPRHIPKNIFLPNWIDGLTSHNILYAAVYFVFGNISMEKWCDHLNLSRGNDIKFWGWDKAQNSVFHLVATILYTYLMSRFASYPIGKKTYGVSDVAHKTYTHS